MTRPDWLPNWRVIRHPVTIGVSLFCAVIAGNGDHSNRPLWALVGYLFGTVGMVMAYAAEHLSDDLTTSEQPVTPPTPTTNRGDDRTGTTFLCDLPCPECQQRTVVGLLLVDENGHHQHTFYVCTFWRSGLTADYRSAYERCGWTGWSIPGWDAD